MTEPVRHAVLRAALFAALLLACGRAPEVDVVEIRDAHVEVEIADSFEAKARGLGERDALAWGRGMLFVYSEASPVAIWMKGMRFDIDIVWIRDGRIVDMNWRAPHAAREPLPVYRPREAADFVLEVPAGYAEAHGFRIGDRVRFQGPATQTR